MLRKVMKTIFIIVLLWSLIIKPCIEQFHDDGFKFKSIYIALKKRPIDTDTVEKFISKISRSLEEIGQAEISSNTIGTMVMEGLKELDPVAYVRFASVYRNFKEEKDFVQFVDRLDVYKKR